MENTIKNKHVVIIGAGTTGIMLANRLIKSGHDVTVIDPATEHYYQPGFLFVPFGRYKIEKLHRPVAKLLRKGIKHVQDKAKTIQPEQKKLLLESGAELDYDVLVIATGTRVDPSMTEGLLGADWRKDVFDYYTPDGAEALRQAMEQFQGGDLVVQIMEMPIKCPVAPLEFTFLSDEYFKKRKLREKVHIKYVTPLSAAFTKPVAAEKLSHLLAERNVEVVTDFLVEKVDPEVNTINCYDGRTVHYDLLVTIPMNVGAEFLKGSDLVNEVGFVEVEKTTLQSVKYPHIFAIGDAADLPTSKAGSVGHFEAHTLQRNIDDYLSGRPVEQTFDGHANCFIESGGKEALLIDFNYDTQPLEGTFPFAGVGPMKLLRPSRINHIGKLAFRHIYWHLLLPGRNIPFIPDRMKLTGKKQPKEQAAVAPVAAAVSQPQSAPVQTNETQAKEGGTSE